jgi:hypothetical protein
VINPKVFSSIKEGMGRRELVSKLPRKKQRKNTYKKSKHAQKD